jgi:glycosyltransferase involved in cell wall biosynthesis
MMAQPQVSVVMSVCNGAATLRESVHSVLSQEGVDFEFIIVDDGSTDASAGMLDEFARADRRIRVIHQENRGLTRALIRGCAEASGKFIARQDCDDLSLPGKLNKELSAIEARPDAVLVSCGTRFVGPNGELLYEVSTAEGDATERLLTLDPQRLRGPAGHGSTLFRRDLFERVGGYREQFYFAQDLDLWTRLVEHGRYLVIPDVLYQVSVGLGSISSALGCDGQGWRRRRPSLRRAPLHVMAGRRRPRTVPRLYISSARVFTSVAIRARDNTLWMRFAPTRCTSNLRCGSSWVRTMNGSRPSVLVIIPTYSRAAFVCDAINSCLAQCNPALAVDIVVLGDGSADATASPFRDFDGSIRVIVLSEDQGRSGTRNVGLSNATGCYVKFLDSDHVLVPGSLRIKVAAAQEAEADMVISGWRTVEMDVEGQIVPIPRCLTGPLDTFHRQEVHETGESMIDANRPFVPGRTMPP